MKRFISLICIAALCTMIFAGCTTNNTETTDETSTITDGSSATTSETSVDDMFTDRDMEIGYSEADSVKIDLADGASVATDASVEISGDTITITDEGTYILSGSLTNGQIIVNAEKTDKLQIVLANVSIAHKSSAALYIKQADKVFVSTANGSENSIMSTGEFVAIDENNIDAAIFSKENITFNGTGTLKVACAAGHGIVSKDDLVFTSGNYEINSADKGLAGNDSIRIADGTFVINSGTDSIHAGNGDDDSTGFVYIIGGTFEISSGDDGVHADTNLTITGASFNITECYEGLEGQSIDISGGVISIVASDDGINAAGGNDGSGFGPGMDRFNSSSDCYINISGGEITVDANGDGIDSNGSLTVSGGYILVHGPTNGGNGALDFDISGVITGGTLLTSGSSGMAMNMGSSSTQASILYYLSSTQAAGTNISLKDTSGNVIVEFTAKKQFQSINISVPQLSVGETYTLVVGGDSYDIELSSTIYSNGSGGAGMGGGNMPQHGGMGGGGSNPGGKT